MYRRPKFLEILLEIRQEMALEADYDVDILCEIARTGKRPAESKRRADLNGSHPGAEASQPQKRSRRKLVKR